jgi:hypothetical protein
MARRFSYEADHEEVRPFGLCFPRGVPVEVADPFIAGKLAGNSHFREHTDAEQDLKAALAESMRLDPPPAAPADAVVLPVVDTPLKRKPGRPRKEA